MIKIEAIIREEQLFDVQEALNNVEIYGITVYQVMGCGQQKGWKSRVRGSEVDINMLPKIKMEIVVSTEEWAEKTIKAIREAAYTGNIGDGKIFVYNIDNVIRIRTGDTGVAAVNPSKNEKSSEEKKKSPEEIAKEKRKSKKK